MTEDELGVGTLLKWVIAMFFAVIVIGAVVWIIWYIALVLNTASQPAVRNNQNHQADTMIANNSYLHNLLGTIETDKTDVKQFMNSMKTYCLVNGLGTLQGLDNCSNLSKLKDLDYNTQQEYERDQSNVDAAWESLHSDVNSYNSYFNNSDVVGVDQSLPTYINSNGSYVEKNGKEEKGI